MDKAEIEKILEEYIKAECFDDMEMEYARQKISQATSSLTALIIKWLEGKKAAIYDLEDISQRPLNIIRNQLITELIGEVR